MDATLKDLLNPPEGTQITFLNIQKYINPHYIKSEPAAAASASAPATPAPAGDKPKVARPTLKKPAAPTKA